MFESLRGQLLVWYTAILAGVIAVFGISVTYLAWRSRIADVDSQIGGRAQAIAAALQPAEAGRFDLNLPAGPAGSAAGVPFYHVLWDEHGRLIDRSDPDLHVERPEPGISRTRDGRREVVVRANAGATVLVGRDLADIRRELWSLAGRLAGVGLAALALSLAGGWWLTDRMLAPIGRISRTARAMVEGDFSARIPIDRVETELGQVARALNDAFDGLHASLERQRRFTADASHELRTPLSTITTELQWALGSSALSDKQRESLEASLRAAGRMESVVKRLLALARAEAGADTDRRVSVRLADATREAVRDLTPLAAARGLDVAVEVEPGAESAAIDIDRDRLLDAIANVVMNAIHYNVPNGTVRIGVGRRADAREITVADTGVGIGPEDLPHVFEPFYRADPARSREAGGAGLGLAVARAIVTGSGGGISCDSTPGQGTTVRMSWPDGRNGAPGL
jgi:signal transduction histidine kinase